MARWTENEDESFARFQIQSQLPPVIRKIGGINRTRKKVYAAISARRHVLNGVPEGEPSASDLARFKSGAH
jgi:hypothetical protein